MKLVFEVAGDKQIERELLRVGAFANDATPAFVAIGELMMAETEKQFATEGRHASGGWAPLKPATLEAKIRGGFRTEILQRTGALLDSLTVKGDANMVFEPRPQELVFGSQLPYAAVHQNPRPENPLPRRRPLEFTETTRRQIVKILQRWVMTGGLA